MNGQPTVENGLFKAGSLWALIGITSWADAANAMTALAAFIGALYSCVLLGEWIYKKVQAWKAPA